jgi:hypothetical protein
MKTRSLSAAIAEIDQHLADLDCDLAGMPAFKRSTKWHTDRVRARAGLLERRQQLVALSTPSRSDISAAFAAIDSPLQTGPIVTTHRLVIR